MSFGTKMQFILSTAVLLFPSRIFSQTASVDFSKTDQVIDGFGGSDAWEGTFSNSLMTTLYGNGANQLGFDILRHRIDPTGAWSSDKTNSQEAKALGATVFATPWSPPDSLKTNNNVVNGYIDSTKFAGFAAWMKSYVTYLGSANVDILSIENEPDYAQQITYEGCGWSASNFEKFAAGYAPLIGKPIMLPESFDYNFALSDPTLDDSAAAKNISYIGGHCYGSQPKTYTKALNLGKHVWMTEWNATDYSATGLMVLAKQILDCMYNDFSAYVYWWMTASGNGVISTSGTPNGYGWVIATFAKYVRPGYYRVDATYNPQSGVYVVAFQGAHDVIIAVNNSTSAKTQSFTISNATMTSVEKYTTSTSKNVSDDGAVTATSNSFSTSLDAQSVTALVSSTASAIQPFNSDGNGWKTAGIGSSSQAMSLIYLMDGRRGRSLYQLGRPSQGIYILNGKVYSSVGMEKSLPLSPDK